jgi:hypothetical protein
MSSENLRKKRNLIIEKIDNNLSEMNDIYEETNRVKTVAENTRVILDDLDKQFCEKTGLNSEEVALMFFAVGLQIARQYLLTKFPKRLSDKEAAKKVKGKKEEHSNRKHRYYNPSLEEIASNPVPFDANIGSNGNLKGGGKMGHRVTTLGHDPILGLIFGTANIATSTLTTSSFLSFHIYTENKRDYFKSKASTYKVLEATVNKTLYQGIEGKKIIATSFIKEIIHLQSDMYTKNSLPIPFISAMNPKLASKLAERGLDMANILTVSKQVTYAMFINDIIAMLHSIFYDGNTEMEEKLHEVKTRKIIAYSDMIASASNLGVVAFTKNLNLLDIGGIGVTILEFIKYREFQKKVKEEFIFGSYKNMVMGDKYNMIEIK